MNGCQPDLFDDHVEPDPAPGPAEAQDDAPPAETLSGDELVGRLRQARLAEAPALYAEVRRRQLAAAIPLLPELWQRHQGFGMGAQAVIDQVEVIRTLAATDGPEAASVLKTILLSVPFPPALLEDALRAAADKQLQLPGDRLVAWAGHNDGAVRELACCLAAYGALRDMGHLLPVLEIVFADDVRPEVRRAAAVALGRLGQLQAKEALLDYLAQDPDAEVIDALGQIADRADDVIVRLGRAARLHPEFRDQIVGILDGLDNPLAATAYREITGENRPD